MSETRWEYKAFERPDWGLGCDHEMRLNFEGRDGWELVSVVSQPGRTMVYFLKRQTQGPADA